jgi:endonuclease/exonuclease/phosphatase (EEP) superfamily protein YafD
MYLNPHRSAAGTTREATIKTAEEDIGNFIRTVGTQYG